MPAAGEGLVDVLSMGIYKRLVFWKGRTCCGLFALLTRCISPLASSFSCFAKKRNPKKATPTVPVVLCTTTLRCSVSEAAAQLAHATWRLRSLRQCSPMAPQRPVLLGGPNGGLGRDNTGPLNFTVVNWRCNFWSSGAFRGPRGPAEKRSGLRGSRRALSESSQLKTVMTSSAAAEDREHRRAVAQRPGRRGRLFFGDFLLAKCIDRGHR